MIKFTFIFIILYWLLVQPKGEKAVNRYITFCAILFIAMMGLRNEAIFGDTYSYVQGYNELGSYSIKDTLERWERDPNFWVFSYLIHSVSGGNYTVWLSVLACLIIIPITKLIRRYSVEPMYSWITFVFVGYMYFLMAGLRQTVALALTISGFLILMNNNGTSEKKQKLWFVACVVLAFFFHGSALVCLVGLFLVNRSFSAGSTMLYVVTILLGLLLGANVLREVTFFIGQYDERYIAYGEKLLGSTYTYFFQQLILVLPSLYFLRKRFREPLVATLFHFAIIGLLFVSLSPVIAEMFRLSFYFAWADIVLFPMAIKSMRKQYPFLPALFMILFILYLVFINGTARLEYYFWFENASHIIQQLP